MLSIEQKITLGDVKNLKDLANELLHLVESARMDLNYAIDNNDVAAYDEFENDLISQVETVKFELGDWLKMVKETV